MYVRPSATGGEQHSFKERTKPILINFIPAEEVINFTPTEEVINFTPTEEVINYIPTEEVINYIPAEEPIKRKAYKRKLD